MRDLNSDLQNRTINEDQLIEYGFIQENNQYILKQQIYNHQFEMTVIFSKSKNISKLVDLENNEEYVLVNIKKSTGEFVGKVREEYENILQDIIDRCTTFNVFQSSQAQDIIKYIEYKYNDHLEYLWKKFSDNAIWRNQKNNKWYGALLIISERKLNIDSDKIIEIIDLRYPKDKIKEFINNKTIYPGYHMNKNNWITIKLDNSVDTQIIYELIDASYQLSLKK